MIKYMCSNGVSSGGQLIKSYEQFGYDLYMAGNFYVEKYACSVNCPCTAASNFNLTLWKDR